MSIFRKILVAAYNSLNNNTINDVIGNKLDNSLGRPGSSSLYQLAGYMGYYHVHSPSLIYPRDAAPINIVAGVGAYNEGTKVEVIANAAKAESFDIHHIILGNISANDDYVIKVYQGEIGSEVFWGEAAFTRDTNQVRGSQVPIQGAPIAAGTRVSAALLSGSGSNNVNIKLFTHEYPVI